MGTTGPRLIALKVVNDLRGPLTVAEVGNGLPFVVRRFFIIGGRGVARGGHAHRAQHQMLVCVSGSVFVRSEHERIRQSFTIWQTSEALYVPPMTWLDMVVENETQLLVLSSGEYDEADYIRDRPDFDSVS